MKKTIMALALSTTLISGAFAEEAHSKVIPHLDHVFLIMMENHGYGQIINNPNAPFTNKLAQSANLATNFFAIGHPSLTNYLEVVGGSNFGVQSDNDTDWHNTSCVPNLITGVANTDVPASPNICPIAGIGVDAVTPAIDTTNEISNPGDIILNIDGIQSIPAAKTVGKTIGDQLVAHHLSWKSYQESLPATGGDGVNFSDGYYTNATDFSQIKPALTPPLSSGDIVKLYAAKHNPFVYFESVQSGEDANNSLKNVVAFDGDDGLFADLRAGEVPSFSFIAPNQCNDQHGRGNAGAFCNSDPRSDGSQAGLNPALIMRGDQTVEKLVTAIKDSPTWQEGQNAIIVMWDENDYSIKPNNNQVVVIVDTNYGKHAVKSNNRYNHYSVLKSLEAGFELPCLNHACDKNVGAMTDLFARH